MVWTQSSLSEVVPFLVHLQRLFVVSEVGKLRSDVIK
jgi:hypothetical protein